MGCKETSGVIYTQETSGVVCTSGERERAAALAQKIRDQVRAELGFTVNVGISCNKLLAKMASDFEKPDRTHTLYPEEVPAKMWPLPIEALHGCGKSTAQKLQLIGINTIGDAASADRALLQSFLGQSSGAYIWNSANGISKSKVVAEREQARRTAFLSFACSPGKSRAGCRRAVWSAKRSLFRSNPRTLRDIPGRCP